MTDTPPEDNDRSRDGERSRSQGPRRRFGAPTGKDGSRPGGSGKPARGKDGPRPGGSGKPARGKDGSRPSGSGTSTRGKDGARPSGSGRPAAGKGGSRPAGSRPTGARGTRTPTSRGPGRPAGPTERSERPRPQPSGPAVPDEVTGGELDREVREELRTLSRDAAETVSRHLVMTARLLDDDPRLAWEHARAAVARGGRLAVVREAAGVAAYRAGEYADALGQLRAARRISGSDAYWPIMADCERGLGRPDRALTMAGAPEVGHLDRAGRAEMRIVASGARRDLGQLDAAVVTLQCAELRSNDRTSWSARIKYAYADTLLAVGRTDEARQWFERAEQVDTDGETEAAERLAELDGLVWTDLEDTDTADAADTADNS